MLGGERQVALVDDIDPAPTKAQTFAASFEKPIEQVNLLAGYIAPGLTTDEQRSKSADRLSVINETLNDPRQGFGQQSLNTVGNIIGGIIPTLPFVAAGGAIGAGLAGAIGFGAREAALELGTEAALSGYLGTQVPLATLAEGAASHYLPNASIGGIATSLVESYGAYKGMIIPEHFAEHYDAVNNSLDTSHAIEDWASDNYGFLLGAAPLAAGYVAFKGIRGVIKHRNAIADAKTLEAEVTRLHNEHQEVLKQNEIKEGERVAREAKVSELQEHLQQAEDMGLITPEHHQWYLDYLENPNDQTKVHEGGLKVLDSLQIPYDRVTGRVWNEVLTREGVANLKSALFDEGITNFSAEENQLLSSYIVHNEMDGYMANMRDNPNLLNAIQGMTHNLGEKIDAQSAALRNFEYALTRHLPKGLLKKQIFSQNNIFQHLRKIGVHSPRDVPYTIPKDVAYKLKLAQQIKLIESHKNRQYQLKYDRGDHLELKKKLKEIKLMHPADELAHLKDTLLPEGKLVDGFKNRKAYHRLEDLSQVWPNAKSLLDRIHMEAMNDKQRGLNEALKKFTEMVDAHVSRLADPDAVKRYLHTRIERAIPITREFERPGVNVENDAFAITNTVHESSPEILFNESSLEQVRETELKFAKTRFEESEQKFKQFSENEQALSELIKCALGG